LLHLGGRTTLTMPTPGGVTLDQGLINHLACTRARAANSSHRTPFSAAVLWPGGSLAGCAWFGYQAVAQGRPLPFALAAYVSGIIACLMMGKAARVGAGRRAGAGWGGPGDSQGTGEGAPRQLHVQGSTLYLHVGWARRGCRQEGGAPHGADGASCAG
jgi:hypothetical protein